MPTPTVELDAQYRQLREECGLLERPERGAIAVRGAGAAPFLQGQVTNDTEALEPGDGCYAALLDRKGHIQADMRVLRPSEGPDLLLDLEPGPAAAVLRHLTMYSVGHEVEVADAGGERTLLSLIGPRAVEVAGSPALPEHACAPLAVAGVECLAVGTAAGVDVFCPVGERERVAAELLDRGAAPVAEEAAEIVRVETGVPRFGVEMGPETMPAEAGIVERAVSFEKGCYIGQETVARLHYRGRPNRHLRGLRLSAPAAAGEPVRKDGKEVGRLGAAVVSPALGPIALAILRREVEPGDEVAVGEDGVTAAVSDLPFG